MAVKFYKCRHCGNVIEKIVDSKVPVVCCGEIMEELKANTVEASVEKHLPVVTVEDNKIKINVGSAPHPMTKEHFISFVYIEKENEGIKIMLNDQPETFSCSCPKDVKAVYAYCNLHGLWKTEL